MTDTFQSSLFTGKVCLCTGNNMSWTSRITGANAVITGRNLAKTETAAKEISKLRKGAIVIGLSADVRDVDQMNGAIEHCVSKLGRLDYLICGAAGNFLADIEHLSPNAFRQVVAIDLLGTYNTCKAALPHIKTCKGSILFVSATLHYYGAHVSAAKAGVDALMQTLAVELGPFGVRVNCIAPGTIGESEGFRLGKVNDISNGTAAWITGHVLVVDGGASQVSTNLLPYPECVTDPETISRDLMPSAGRKTAKI